MAFGKFSGEVWSTHSLISGLPFGILLGADFGSMDSMTLNPAEAGWGASVRTLFPALLIDDLVEHFHICVFVSQFPDSRVFSYKNPTQLIKFTLTGPPLMLKNCSKLDYCLFYSTPLLKLR